MKNRVLSFATALACFCLAAVDARGEVKLPRLLSDGVVLQQDKKVNIWGSANAGEKVTVTFRDQAATAVAGKEGSWKAQLGPFSAGGPYTLLVAGNHNRVIVRDVLVGEVWVCSGQSNMTFAVQESLDSAQAIVSADYPYIHLFNVAETAANKPQDDVSGRWMHTRPETVADFSAVCYFFGRSLYKALNVPIGLIHSSWSGTNAESWISHQGLQSDPRLARILEKPKNIWRVVDDYQRQFDEWKTAAKAADAQGDPIVSPPAPSFGDGNSWAIRPSSLFNGMVAPLTNDTIAGVAWYQGESNARRALQYGELFPALIRDWRRHWNEGDFPFLFVQLPNLANLNPQFKWNWPLLQEAQLKTFRLVPRTAMIVTIDIGDVGNLHPKNKEPVGYRLSLAALALAYGRDIPYSGPVLDSQAIEGSDIRLRFQHSDGGLMAKPIGRRSTLVGFEVAGKDQKFAFADTRIEGDTIVVNSSEVPHPVAVRYCFHWAQECNLYNEAGLPASPFRTDDWSTPDAQ